jgi:hypothetical protein
MRKNQKYKNHKQEGRKKKKKIMVRKGKKTQMEKRKGRNINL